MPDVNEIEKKFLKIMGIEVHEWGLHDTEEKGSNLKDPEKTEYNGKTIRTYEYTETYHGNKCDVSFITKGDRDENGNSENEKKAVQVVRGNLKYVLEYDESKKEWTVYVVESWHTDYSRYAIGITAKMVYGDFCINISDSTDGPIEIKLVKDAIYCKSRYEGTKKIIFTPSNFEEILRSSIKKIYTTEDDEEYLSEAFAKFVPLFLDEIIYEVLEQERLDIQDDPSKNRKFVDLGDLQIKFREYTKMKSRQLSEIELEFLKLMGIELEGYDYDFDCNILFDSDISDTFRFFGTRNVKDGTVDKRISTYMLNGTTVDLVEELPNSSNDDVKPNKEIRVIRNDMEYILQLRDLNFKPGVALFIEKHRPESSKLYYRDHHHIPYYIDGYNSPEIKIVQYSGGVYVHVHGIEGFESSNITFNEVQLKKDDSVIPFTVEDFQECLTAIEMSQIEDPDIRNEYMYFLPLLSEFIPMTLIANRIKRLSRCCCDHELHECEKCGECIEDAKEMERFTLLLEKFNAYITAKAEIKSKQKLLEEKSE